MNFGSSVPSLSGTVTGFVGGDTLGSPTTGTLAFNTTATSLSPVGSYAISGAGLTANPGNTLSLMRPAMPRPSPSTVSLGARPVSFLPPSTATRRTTTSASISRTPERRRWSISRSIRRQRRRAIKRTTTHLPPRCRPAPRLPAIMAWISSRSASTTPTSIRSSSCPIMTTRMAKPPSSPSSPAPSRTIMPPTS
jgi:hypothetical protein